MAAAATEATATAETEASHYAQVAAAYETAFFYADQKYQDFVKALIVPHLHRSGTSSCNAQEEYSFVDIGGGTGNFTVALAAQLGPEVRGVCVEPSAAMAMQAASRGLAVIEADAVAFVRDHCIPVHAALMKEVVHHIPPDEWESFFQLLSARMANGSSLVIITRPHEAKYPLFPKALENWRKGQPHSDGIIAAMAAAGFECSLQTASYPITLPYKRWERMVRSRFWSVLGPDVLSDSELEDGLAHMSRNYLPANGIDGDLTFDDQLLVLRGKKAESPLPESAKSQFAKQGYWPIIRVLSEAEAATGAEMIDSLIQAVGEGPLNCRKLCGKWRFKLHLVDPWIWALVHRPAILDAVQQLLGTPNLVCWSTDIFHKEPGEAAHVGWHQDSTYVAMDPPDVVTVWIALEPSTRTNGCLEVSPGSHNLGQLPHSEHRDPSNQLLLGQTIDDTSTFFGSDSEAVHLELQPGEASIHHIYMVHRAGRNVEDSTAGGRRRLGIAIRYMAAHVQQALDHKDSVTLCRGTCSQELEFERAPIVQLGQAECERHSKAVAAVFPKS